jgi:hypothetical protein
MTSPVGRSARALGIVSALLLCAALAACATPRPGSSDPSASGTPSITPSVTPTVSAEPTPVPTTTDAQSTPSPSSVGDVSVVVITLDVAGGALEVSGMVPNLVEDGGRCTAEIRRGDVVRSVDGATSAARESTYCALLTVPVSQLTSGEWQVTLTYDSAAHRGVSQVSRITVP